MSRSTFVRVRVDDIWRELVEVMQEQEDIDRLQATPIRIPPYLERAPEERFRSQNEHLVAANLEMSRLQARGEELKQIAGELQRKCMHI